VNGSPAYYRPQTALALAADSGDAQLGKGQGIAVETMLRTVRSSLAYNPLGVYVPWARQKGGVTWETIEEPDHDLVLYPIDAATVDRVNAASYGHELPWVGVIAERPTNSRTADEAWDATRYDLFAVEGLYDVDDARPAPRICFLYWAKLHDDVGGGRASLDAVAQRLGGRLVFPMQVPVSDARQLPSLPFSMVLNAQLAGPAGLPELAGFGAESPMLIAAPPTERPPSSRLGLGILAVAMAATGYVFWSTVRPRQRANARRRRR